MNSNKPFVPENVFLIFGIIFGLMFVAVTPPFKVPDEPNHFLRTIQISEGTIFGEKGQKGIGGLIPESIISTITVFDGFPYHAEKEQKTDNIFSLLRQPLEKEKRVFADFPNTSLYSPVPYLPQVIGVSVAISLNCSPLAIMYAGRVSNLAAWVFLVYLSIKFVPLKKWLFFLLALTPMSIYQAASLSADSLTNGLAFLLIALFLRYALEGNRKIGPADTAIILILSVMMSLSKQAYFILSFLFLLIPADKTGSKIKHLLIFAAIILVNIAAAVLWSLSVRDLYEGIYSFYGKLLPGVSPSGQIRFIISNPQEYVMVLLRTLTHNIRPYLQQFIGQLGWMDIAIPEPLSALYGIILLITAVCNREILFLHARNKAVIFAVLLAGMALVATLFYLSFNPVASTVIGGIQGRYFIPLSPLLFLLFSNRLIPPDTDKYKFKSVIIFLPVLSSLYSIYAIIQRYYN